MFVAEVFSVLGFVNPSPLVIKIVFQTFETGLVFLLVMSPKDVLVYSVWGSECTCRTGFHPDQWVMLHLPTFHTIGSDKNARAD
jgi:hypothetical protein